MQRDAQPTRASLLLQLRHADNDAAWEQFAQIYAPIIHGFCRNQGLQPADAADVTQEVMRAVAQAMKKFAYDRQRGKFRNWLLTVTRSKLSNFFAQRQRVAEPAGHSKLEAMMDSEPTAAEQSVWDAEYHGRLFQWAADQVRPSIQESTWQAFWRTTIGEEEVSKVAADLHLSIGSVYVAKGRVLARLRTAIQSVDEEANTGQ